MIASLLQLNPRGVQALKLTDPYSIHRVVYGLFEDVRSEQQKQDSVSSGFLFADKGGDARGRQILMLSDREPLRNLNQDYGEIRSTGIAHSFLEHETYRFEVIVNPVYRQNATGKIMPVKGRESIAQWFEDRAVSSWGFKVALEQLSVDEVIVKKFNDKKSREVTLAQAHVSGVLSVIDRERFQKSFSLGIGRAKTFGCGLLQVTLVVQP